jgi:Beta/Gamma crystallin
MSRRIAVRAAALTLATGLFWLAAPANAAPAPEGTYQHTCRDVSATSVRLSATCRTRNGGWVTTKLDGYRRCSDVANIDGVLVCERDDAGSGNGGHHADEDRGSNAQSAHGGHSDRGTGNSDRDHDNGDRNDSSATNYPAGAYRDTCRNIHTMGDDLVAECRTWDGEWHRVKVENYKRCGDRIINDDGRLRCGEGGGHRGEGEHRSEDHGDRQSHDGGNDERWGRITLFEKARFHGNQRVYSDDAAELGPMSDRASSASVSGGSWKLCTKRNFRGRCVTINDSVRDFTDIGLNDRVESIRRVR